MTWINAASGQRATLRLNETRVLWYKTAARLGGGRIVPSCGTTLFTAYPLARHEQPGFSRHSVNGDGPGSVAVVLDPKPRNSRAGPFKIESTPGALVPAASLT